MEQPPLDFSSVATGQDFAALASHEFRSQLTSLQASIELLQSGQFGHLSAQGQRMLRIAADSTDRLVDLTSSVLASGLLRLEATAVTLKPCNLVDLLLQVQQQCEIEITLSDRLNVRPLSVQVWVDWDRMVHLLSYLVHRTQQSAHLGDRVGVQAQFIELKLPVRTAILIRVFKGPQLSSEKHPSPQSPESIAIASNHRDAAKRLQLDLALCCSIAQQHEGFFWVDQTPDFDNIFSLILPYR